MDYKIVEKIKDCINAGVGPILMNKNCEMYLPNHAVLYADSNLEDILPKYDNEGNVKMPLWYKDATLKKVLVIEGLDEVEESQQLKFGEILKYKKVSQYNLNPNMLIVVLADEKKVSEEILNLTVQV